MPGVQCVWLPEDPGLLPVSEGLRDKHKTFTTVGNILEQMENGLLLNEVQEFSNAFIQMFTEHIACTGIPLDLG